MINIIFRRPQPADQSTIFRLFKIVIEDTFKISGIGHRQKQTVTDLIWVVIF